MATPRPDPTTPAGVAAATFNTVRKGADPDAVHTFLRHVADEMAQLQSEVRDLRMQLADERGATPELDEAQITQFLGEETTRIVQAAREAAVQIRQKAEDAAAQLLRDANDEATRTRTDTEQELARLRAQAQSDALAEVDQARNEGRAMVAEARDYREKVLADVNRRRDLARQQLTDVEAGRRRLLQVFENARLASTSVLDDLGSLAADAPDDFVNLSPVTGPVPLIVPGAAPEPEPEMPAVLPAAEELLVEESLVEEPAPDPASDPEPEPPVDATDEAADEPAPAGPETLEVVDVVEIETEEEQSEPDPPAVVGLYAGELESPLAAELGGAEGGGTSVDDLFAKLRRASAEMVAREAPANEPTEAAVATDERGPFGVRDEVLVPLIVASAKKLKRVLADEQNEVLDHLRRNQAGDTLPGAADHVARYASAIEPELRSAMSAGASSVGGTMRREASVAKTTKAAVANGIVSPLRERLQRAVDQAGADSNELASLVRAVYREWKSSRIDDQIDDVLRLAFDEGAFAAVTPGTPVQWVLDPHSGACGPDCEDNSLGGAVAAGEPFPTGHLHPPLHGGCRCLLQTTSQ
jgi:cell division septum initiation protein DivIVA